MNPVFWVLGKVWDFVWELIKKYFPEIGPAQSRFATGALILFPCLLMVWILVRWYRARSGRSGTGFRQHPDAPVKPTGAADWFEVARSLAGDRDFRPAATALYQGLVLTMETFGVVRSHPSKTPGEYSREAPQNDIGDGFRTFLQSFQRFAFAQEPPSSKGYQNLLKQAEQLSTQARATGKS